MGSIKNKTETLGSILSVGESRSQKRLTFYFGIECSRDFRRDEGFRRQETSTNEWFIL